MAKIKLNKEKCKGCLLCADVCPRKALAVGKELNSKGLMPMEAQEGVECAACGLCVLICPDCCIEITK